MINVMKIQKYVKKTIVAPISDYFDFVEHVTMLPVRE